MDWDWKCSCLSSPTNEDTVSLIQPTQQMHHEMESSWSGRQTWTEWESKVGRQSANHPGIKSSIETARRITRPAAARPSGDEVSGGASSWEGACGGPRCWWSNRQCGVVTGSALSEDLFFTGTRKESCNWRISHVLTRSSTAGVFFS